LVHHEGRESSLRKKGKGSIVILEDRDGVIYWHNDRKERVFIGPDATCIYDAKSSKVIANQLHVRDEMITQVMSSFNRLSQALEDPILQLFYLINNTCHHPRHHPPCA
jgi:hypothetical protein